MCIGATAMAVAQFAISAASTVAGFVQQQNEADAQNERYRDNALAANKAAATKYASQQNRALQERKAAGQEQEKLQTQGLKARSTAEVAAGQAGVTGLSVDALLADFYGQEGRHERTLDTNYQMQADYLRGELDATQSQAESRINSVQQAEGPSFAGAAIRILGSGLDAFSSTRKPS